MLRLHCKDSQATVKDYLKYNEHVCRHMHHGTGDALDTEIQQREAEWPEYKTATERSHTPTHMLGANNVDWARKPET